MVMVMRMRKGRGEGGGRGRIVQSGLARQSGARGQCASLSARRRCDVPNSVANPRLDWVHRGRLAPEKVPPRKRRAHHEPALPRRTKRDAIFSECRR